MNQNPNLWMSQKTWMSAETLDALIDMAVLNLACMALQISELPTRKVRKRMRKVIKGRLKMIEKLYKLRRLYGPDR